MAKFHRILFAIGAFISVILITLNIYNLGDNKISENRTNIRYVNFEMETFWICENPEFLF